MSERTCECVQTSRDTTEQRTCGKPATHSAYEPPIYFCADCLHEMMQDASLEGHESVKDLQP